MERLSLQRWLPIRFFAGPGGARLDWCWFADQALTEPFFADSVNRALRLPINQAMRRETSLQALLEWQRESPGIAPRAFIHHASRCGSTLLTQLLGSLDSHIALSEPPALDQLLRAGRQGLLQADEQRAWLGGLLSAFGQPRRGERELVIKLDAWNIFEAEVLHGLFPHTPWLFVYREPLEIVASHLHQPGRHMVPGLIGASGLDACTLGADQGERIDFIARRTGALLLEGLEQCQRLGGIAVNYSELPNAVWGRLAEVLGVAPGDAVRLRATARFDSKRTGEHFVADGANKRASLDDAWRAPIERWTRAPYEALERLRLQQA